MPDLPPLKPTEVGGYVVRFLQSLAPGTLLCGVEFYLADSWLGCRAGHLGQEHLHCRRSEIPFSRNLGRRDQALRRDLHVLVWRARPRLTIMCQCNAEVLRNRLGEYRKEQRESCGG